MVNKSLIFIKKYWNHCVFFMLTLSSFSFLFFQKGVWLYNDLGWWPKNGAENTNILKQFLFSWDNFSDSYFGFDRYMIAFEKIVSSPFIYISNLIFGSYQGQIVFFLVLISTAYIFAIKLIRKLELENYKVAALFFCFNPISVYLIAQGTVYAAYCVVPLFLYSLVKVLEKINIRYILLNILSLAILATYLRILGVVLLFLVIIILLYSDKVYVYIKRLDYKIILVTVVYLIAFSGILSSLMFTYKNNSNSQANYITHQTNLYAKDFYDMYHTGDFLSFISLNQITANFGGKFTVTNEVFSALLICCLIYYQFIKKWAVTRFEHTMFLVLILVLCTLISARFLSQSAFIFIFSHVLLFLSSNLLWIRIIEVLCLVSLIACKNRRILNIFVSIFILISILPLLLWHSNIKLDKLSDTNNFYQDNMSNHPALFYPSNLNIYNTVALTDAPYPINPTYNASFHYLFSNNPRLVDENQIDLYSLSNYPLKLYIFGLKDLFIFKDVKEFKSGEFDWYSDLDYKAWAIYYNNLLLNNKFHVSEDNSTYIHYTFADSNNYDYLLYSPKTIIIATSTTSLPDIGSLPVPVLFLSSRLMDLDSSQLDELSSSLKQNIKLEIKYSFFDPTKYYIKVTNVDKTLPLMIHLNQTFNPQWSIFSVNGNVWDSKVCKMSEDSYSSTQNKSCEYNYSISDYFSISFLDKHMESLKNIHISGNIVGNTFIVDSKTISDHIDSNGDMYFLVYFQKQDYYICFLLLFILTILGLIIIPSSIKPLKMLISRIAPIYFVVIRYLGENLKFLDISRK